MVKWLKQMKKRRPKFFQALVCVVILTFSVLLSGIVITNGGEVPKQERDEAVTLVELLPVYAGDEQVYVTGYGVVQPHEEVTLTPQVGGVVIGQHENLVAGGRVKRGEYLLQVDPRDYQAAVEQEKAAVARAEFELQQEQGRGVVAKKEWELLDGSIPSSELGRQLSLREPHLKEKQSALQAARSRLVVARLNLERTALTAPFNALVVNENVQEGQLISPQSPVATLVNSDTFHVEVSIPYAALEWVEIGAAEAMVSRQVDGHGAMQREGIVERLLGDVDPNGRMARVHVSVTRPLEGSPLLLGAYVRVDIAGPVLKDVVALPRKALRNDEEVWVESGGKLAIRRVQIVARRDEDVLVDSGLSDGDRVVISPLPVAVPGMLLRGEDN